MHKGHAEFRETDPEPRVERTQVLVDTDPMRAQDRILQGGGWGEISF